MKTNTHTLMIESATQRNDSESPSAKTPPTGLSESASSKAAQESACEAALGIGLRILARMEADAAVPEEERSKLLAGLKIAEDRVFAFSIGANPAHGLPHDQQRALALRFCRASTEQLAVIRERVQAGAPLRNRDGVLALVGI